MTVKITLKQVREARKLSQNKLAQIIGMTLQNVQRIEYGDAKSIPLDTLDKLCEALNCQTGDLLVRVPDDDNKQADLMIEQIINNLKPLNQKQDIKSSNSKENAASWFEALPEIPQSA
ncbi:hypothetical protein H1P_4020005 [Hyella patelloides LEGE 07179]|uniref:HTH cro/C1-type domain-containing protein n=1 Tax=Hyella patelloides LEGE 07179 TaxID=945734 RepID=A0A563VXB0_9CYAN|nr:helix-turn-helix transcriptional regulator [Hyella patelloides]VEP16094.1 hypothetical protein H1P_4020005 [Hyella patelloides LEGE 07179]